MKEILSNLFLLSTLIFSLTACEKQEEETDETDLESIKTTTLSESLDQLYLSDDLSMILDSSDLLESINSYSSKTSLNVAQKTGLFYSKWDNYGSCAEVTVDTLNQIKTIDFGSGCIGKRGILRSGKIIISYSGNNEQVGDFRQMQFVDYFKDSINVQGTRKTQVIDIDENNNKTFLITLTDGMLVYKDGTFETKSSEITRFEYKDDSDSSLNYSSIFGKESGIDSDGTSFTSEITTPIKFVFICNTEILDDNESLETYYHRGRGHRHGKRIPVEGVKNLTTDNEEIVIDFGDGECDTLAEVTTNGISEIVDISTLISKDNFKKLMRYGRGRN